LVVRSQWLWRSRLLAAHLEQVFPAAFGSPIALDHVVADALETFEQIYLLSRWFTPSDKAAGFAKVGFLERCKCLLLARPSRRCRPSDRQDA
jgi:hypothetical protein